MAILVPMRVHPQKWVIYLVGIVVILVQLAHSSIAATPTAFAPFVQHSAHPVPPPQRSVQVVTLVTISRATIAKPVASQVSSVIKCNANVWHATQSALSVRAFSTLIAQCVLPHAFSI